MRYKTSCLILTCIISVVMISNAWAGPDQPDPSSDILYFEDYVQAIEDEPETRFHRAREYFFKDDMESAAKEIRKAAVLLRLESGWATNEGKRGLIASAIELDKLAGEPVDILVNNRLIAQGEVVVIDENFGVRVTDIISQSDRLKKLK